MRRGPKRAVAALALVGLVALAGATLAAYP